MARRLVSFDLFRLRPYEYGATLRLATRRGGELVLRGRGAFEMVAGCGCSEKVGQAEAKGAAVRQVLDQAQALSSSPAAELLFPEAAVLPVAIRTVRTLLDAAQQGDPDAGQKLHQLAHSRDPIWLKALRAQVALFGG
jgi:hypothetical protein